jgi:hypothetical protein
MSERRRGRAWCFEPKPLSWLPKEGQGGEGRPMQKKWSRSAARKRFQREGSSSKEHPGDIDLPNRLHGSLFSSVNGDVSLRTPLVTTMLFSFTDMTPKLPPLSNRQHSSLPPLL